MSSKNQRAAPRRDGHDAVGLATTSRPQPEVDDLADDLPVGTAVWVIDGRYAGEDCVIVRRVPGSTRMPRVYEVAVQTGPRQGHIITTRARLRTRWG